MGISAAIFGFFGVVRKLVPLLRVLIVVYREVVKEENASFPELSEKAGILKPAEQRIKHENVEKRLKKAMQGSPWLLKLLSKVLDKEDISTAIKFAVLMLKYARKKALKGGKNRG